MVKMWTLCHVMSLFSGSLTVQVSLCTLFHKARVQATKGKHCSKNKTYANFVLFDAPQSLSLYKWHNVGSGNSCRVPWSMWASNTGKHCTISVLLSLRQSVQVALRSFKNLFHEARERAAKALGFAKKLTKVGTFFLSFERRRIALFNPLGSRPAAALSLRNPVQREVTVKWSWYTTSKLNNTK